MNLYKTLTTVILAALLAVPTLAGRPATNAPTVAPCCCKDCACEACSCCTDGCCGGR